MSERRLFSGLLWDWTLTAELILNQPSNTQRDWAWYRVCTKYAPSVPCAVA